ncbi:MAG TPA: thiol:disulfide interchange protein DsbA/DsbL [Noviherbaspirillum sp.]|nr:thiol:disulfide interchange protein DsbA/DsbL [Noviherbaspirillum sp.]
MRSLAPLARFVAALSFGFMALGVSAAPDNPQSGVDYRTLDKPQPTESGNRVEVIEFFWYSCPHCNSLEPSLNDWVKKQGDTIAFRRVPIAFRESMMPQQKLYYTLEAMGNLETMHPKVFHTIHVQRRPLDSETAIVNWVVSQGIDKQKFLDVFNSFGVQSKVRRAQQLQQAYQVDGVPMLAVDGRYVTSPAIISSSIGNRPEPVLYAATFQVMDALVARAAKDKRAAAPAK